MFEESRGSICSGCFRQVFWGVAGVDLGCFYTSIVDVVLVLFWAVVWYMYSGMLPVSWGAVGVVPGCRLMQVLRGCFRGCLVRVLSGVVLGCHLRQVLLCCICCSGVLFDTDVVEVFAGVVGVLQVLWMCCMCSGCCLTQVLWGVAGVVLGCSGHQEDPLAASGQTPYRHRVRGSRVVLHHHPEL